MKKKMLRCSVCKKVKRDVKVKNDPYEEDVNNRKVKVKLCNSCTRNLCDEV